MSETTDEYCNLLDQLNEEFAEALSLVLINPDDVREWGYSCNVLLDEFIEALDIPDQLIVDMRGMPIWSFNDFEGKLELYVVQLDLPGVEHLTLVYNALDPVAGKCLEVF